MIFLFACEKDRDRERQRKKNQTNSKYWSINMWKRNSYDMHQFKEKNVDLKCGSKSNNFHSKWNRKKPQPFGKNILWQFLRFTFCFLFLLCLHWNSLSMPRIFNMVRNMILHGLKSIKTFSLEIKMYNFTLCYAYAYFSNHISEQCSTNWIHEECSEWNSHKKRSR